MSGSIGARLRKTGIAVLGLLVSAVSLFLVARSVDIGATGRLIATAAPGPLAVALCLYLVSLTLRFVIWETLLPPRADGSRVNAGRIAPILMVGLLGNLVLPARLGEVIRAYLISRRESIAFSGALGSVALERVVDTATLAVMAFVAAVGAGAAIWIVRGTGFLAVAGIVLLVALAATGLRPILNILARLRAIKVLEAPITLVYARVEWFVHWSGGAHRRRAMGIALCLSSAAWLCNAAMFLMAGQAVGAPISPPGALLVMAVTVLATAIPAAPAYVGTFELAAVTVAASLSVPADTALAMAVLSHAIGVVPTAIGGSASLAYLGGGLRVLSSSAVKEGRMNAGN